MGALTSKLYAYKARPWELSSHATISIQDPFLTRIYIESRDNKILRILPLVGTEEWIQDDTRFFISVNRLKNSTIKFDLNFQYNIENAALYNRTLATKTTLAADLLYKLTHNIYKTLNTTIIVDKSTDAKTLNVLRLLNKHKDRINIKFTNGFVTCNPSVHIPSLSDTIQKPALYLTQNKDAQSMMQTKLINYKSSPLSNSSITVNFYESLHLAEARLLLDHNLNTLMLVSSTRFGAFFSFVKNKLILDSQMHMVPFFKADSLSFSKRNMIHVSLDINSVLFLRKQNFTFSDMVKTMPSVNYIWPKSNFFSQSLFLINLFGEVNKTTPVFPASYIHDNLFILINLSLMMFPLSQYVNIYLRIFKLIK